MDIENMNIEKATERCKALTNPEQGCWIGISNQKAIEIVLSELEKKDKVINLMIEEGSHIPENELYKVEKIYREVKDQTELKGRDLKLYCIKEYFTNKVG